MPRKPFVVNETVREKVRHLAGVGVRQDDIARIIGCAPKTLRKQCRDDLDRGVAEANAMVSGSLFAAAKGGNVTAQIFWLKTRAHWRENAARSDAASGSDAEGSSPVVLVLPDNSRDPELVQDRVVAEPTKRIAQDIDQTTITGTRNQNFPYRARTDLISL